MGRAPCGDRLQTTLLQWAQKTKREYTKKTGQGLTPKPGGIEILPISTPSLQAHTLLGTEMMKTLLLGPLATTKRDSETGILYNQILLLPIILIEPSGVFSIPPP